MMTDGELVCQALAGRSAAREELARRWAPRVLAVCQARVGRTAAEDLAQDSLFGALRSLPQLAAADCFGPWLRSIAVRKCVDWLRRKRLMERPWSTLSSEVRKAAQPFASDSNAMPVEAREQSGRLWMAVEHLPEELRETLLLFYCDNLTYDGVAEVLDISRTTVNSRLAKAREILRRHLEPDLEREDGLHTRS